MKDAGHAMCTVTLGSTDEMVQCLPRLDSELILEQGRPFVDLCCHEMNSHANGRFSMKHLPERGHHAFISGKRSVMNVNAAPRRQGKERLFQDVWAGNGDNYVCRTLTNRFHELGGVWVANLLVWDGVGSGQLFKTVELLSLSTFPDFAKDAVLCSSGDKPDEPHESVERREFPQHLDSRSLPHRRTARNPHNCEI